VSEFKRRAVAALTNDVAPLNAELLALGIQEINALSSKLDASQKALRSFVTAAKSWHEMHHPIGTAAVQCDWLCECIPAGEEALK